MYTSAHVCPHTHTYIGLFCCVLMHCHGWLWIILQGKEERVYLCISMSLLSSTKCSVYSITLKDNITYIITKKRENLFTTNESYYNSCPTCTDVNYFMGISVSCVFVYSVVKSPCSLVLTYWFSILGMMQFNILYIKITEDDLSIRYSRKFLRDSISQTGELQSFMDIVSVVWVLIRREMSSYLLHGVGLVSAAQVCFY